MVLFCMCHRLFKENPSQYIPQVTFRWSNYCVLVKKSNLYLSLSTFNIVSFFMIYALPIEILLHVPFEVVVYSYREYE